MIMKQVLCMLLLVLAMGLQGQQQQEKTRVMTLGVFHFSFPNLDAVKTAEQDQISVLDEPFQSQILAIARELSAFGPTFVACEFYPEDQAWRDSLYALYRADQWELPTNEIYQLGFRIARQQGLDRVYGVDDRGRHYHNLLEIFQDPARDARFDEYFFAHFLEVTDHPLLEKVSDISHTLYQLNQPDFIHQRLASYLFHPFKYEEEPGDFTGVDFESGRWFNRNLRILRNLQRLPYTAEDRILLIVGAEHLNLLNWFIDASPEFELVSPLPYLENALLETKAKY
jgi:hypothetical protein